MRKRQHESHGIAIQIWTEISQKLAIISVDILAKVVQLLEQKLGPDTEMSRIKKSKPIATFSPAPINVVSEPLASSP
ncbi:hypothetical protein GWO43_07180 [candidate division KSB1 bacterium]|nr:hypothetical protein [candidate division KSB1 bacterium]NIR72847.1 hypothetical protein [candidate division KSB1 bacterium]NIS23746.1 hypothetical protein [candidate division KSB1 bacterium]NIT70667.1 hypothetical protein [candidate division KSB1 bacterium]NIU24396.1 hypothetical protein [candidate division KSB1 bacterium]